MSLTLVLSRLSPLSAGLGVWDNGVFFLGGEEGERKGWYSMWVCGGWVGT